MKQKNLCMMTHLLYMYMFYFYNALFNSRKKLSFNVQLTIDAQLAYNATLQ